MKIKEGMVVKIPKKSSNILRSMSIKVASLRNEIAALAQLASDCDRERWLYLYSIFPELAEYKLSYDYTKNEVLVMREYKDWEKEGKALEIDTWKLIKKAKEKGWIPEIN